MGKILKSRENLNSGITLIALIVTIIVLLLLAGVSITMLTGENSIITKANEVAFKTKIASYEEEVEIYIAKNELESSDGTDVMIPNCISGTDSDEDTVTIKDVIKGISDQDAEKYAVIDGKLVYLGEIDENQKSWLEDSNVEISNGINISVNPNSSTNTQEVNIDINVEHYLNVEINTIKYLWLDNNSQIDKNDSQWDSAQVYNEDNKITVSLDNNKKYLHIYAEDIKNNTKVYVSEGFNWVTDDKTLPEISVSEEPLKPVKSVAIIINASDDETNISEVKYIYTESDVKLDSNDEIWNSATLYNNVAANLDSVTGEYYLHIRAMDGAENYNTYVSKKYIIDNEKPTVTMKINSDYGGVYLDITSEDKGAGFDFKEKCIEFGLTVNSVEHNSKMYGVGIFGMAVNPGIEKELYIESPPYSSILFEDFFEQDWDKPNINSSNQYEISLRVVDKAGNYSDPVTVSGYGCFVSGTKIWTENGFVNIEDLKISDYVYTYNIEKKEIELSKIKEIWTTNNSTYKIKTLNSEIEGSSEHKVYIDGFGYKKIQDLIVGEKILLSTGEFSEIKEINSNTDKKTLYNFSVENNNNYFISEEKMLVEDLTTEVKTFNTYFTELKYRINKFVLEIF